MDLASHWLTPDFTFIYFSGGVVNCVSSDITCMRVPVLVCLCFVPVTPHESMQQKILES